MYLDVKLCKRSAGNSLAKESLVLAAGEIPSEPGGVGARTIPFRAGSGAEEMLERFVAVAGNGARRDGAARDGWAKRAGIGGGKSCRGAVGSPPDGSCKV